jgi:hypothetical protein
MRDRITSIIRDVIRKRRCSIELRDGRVLDNMPEYMPRKRLRKEPSILVRIDLLTLDDDDYSLALRGHQLAGGKVTRDKIKIMRNARVRGPIQIVVHPERRWKRPEQTAP